MAHNSTQKRNNDKLIKVAFGLMAIVCLLTGLALYLFAEKLGFDDETARYVAIAFLVAGAGDYIVLRFWDRLRKNR